MENSGKFIVNDPKKLKIYASSLQNCCFDANLKTHGTGFLGAILKTWNVECWNAGMLECKTYNNYKTTC